MPFRPVSGRGSEPGLAGSWAGEYQSPSRARETKTGLETAMAVERATGTQGEQAQASARQCAHAHLPSAPKWLRGYVRLSSFSPSGRLQLPPGDGLFPGASGKQALAARWGEPTALGACAWVRAALLPLSHPSPAPWEDCRVKLAHGPFQR